MAIPASHRRGTGRKRRDTVITETTAERSRRATQTAATGIAEPPTEEHRKFYFDGGQVEIVTHLVHELDPNGKQLRVVKYTDYAADSVRTLCPTSPRTPRALGRCRKAPRNHSRRSMSAASTFNELAEQHGPARRRSLRSALPPGLQRAAADAPRTCPAPEAGAERTFSRGSARRPAKFLTSFLRNMPSTAMHSSSCRMSCSVPPISTHGQPAEIIKLFGGPDQLRAGRKRPARTSLWHELRRTAQQRQHRRPPRKRWGACSNPRATSCARTRASTATSTGCRCSPGSCSSSSWTTWNSSARRRPSSRARSSGRRSNRPIAGGTGRPTRKASPATSSSPSSIRTKPPGPMARAAPASSPTCAPFQAPTATTAAT